ncbi:MAG: transaldolase, partial [Chloroflexota bacterium]|nr:transaldolase [Chloroflexota bacterium]
MDNPILQAQALGQSVWYDNIRRDFFASGRFDQLLRWGITGVTSNPTIFEKALASSSDYDAQLAEVWAGGASAVEV